MVETEGIMGYWPNVPHKCQACGVVDYIRVLPADDFLVRLRAIAVTHNLPWHEPGKSLAEDGRTTEISNWRKDRALIFAVEDTGTVHYLRAWGPNIYNDMEEGQSPTDDELVSLWKWACE